jgi:uncharacterized membrane protein YidH (DUF202 family)
VELAWLRVGLGLVVVAIGLGRNIAEEVMHKKVVLEGRHNTRSAG